MVLMPESPRIVVGVTGRIGSGKTAVARHLAELLGAQYLRYSQILAEWFKVDPSDKRRLQEVGEAVMSGDGQKQLNQRLVGRIDSARDAVVDGLRHPIDFESLRARFGLRFFLVFVDTPAEIRYERLRKRFDTYASFRDADLRTVESNIDSLRADAATVLPGTMATNELTGSLQRLVGEFRQRIVA
jgi:dephospho-CoA kinase